MSAAATAKDSLALQTTLQTGIDAAQRKDGKATGRQELSREYGISINSMARLPTRTRQRAGSLADRKLQSFVLSRSANDAGRAGRARDRCWGQRYRSAAAASLEAHPPTPLVPWWPWQRTHYLAAALVRAKRLTL